MMENIPQSKLPIVNQLGNDRTTGDGIASPPLFFMELLSLCFPNIDSFIPEFYFSGIINNVRFNAYMKKEH